MELVDYKPSKTLYAINFAEPDFYENIGVGENMITQVVFHAISTITKKDVRSVSYGLLKVYYSDFSSFSIEEFKRNFDGRYGLDVFAKWDGTYLFAKNTPLKEMNEYADFLDPVLQSIPNTPDKYEGWYKL